MEFCLHTNLLIILYCFHCKYSSVKIKPKLHKNVLKFGYGINYKYEGMLAHSFDRFSVVTKFILPMMDDLKLSPIKYHKECNYLHNLDDQIKEKYKRFAFLFCKNKTIHGILQNAN